MEKTAGKDGREEKRRLAAAEEEAFFERIAPHRRKLYAIAFSYLHSETDALEAIQEATCRAWIKRGKLKNPDYLVSWLVRIVINCCMDELRRRKRAYPAAEIESRGDGEMRSDDRIDLDRAMRKMKPKYRHAVTLKYYHGMTSAEIARVLGRPEGTIKTWLREGLRQMRAWL